MKQVLGICAHVAIRCGAVKAAAHLDLEQSVRVQRIRSELVYFRWPGEGQQTSSSRKQAGLAPDA